MEDLEIVEQLKQGSEECFIQVVDKFKKKVISLCYTYTSDYQEAEDLSQDVFISFYNSIDKFRGDCSISTYIYRIAVSRCLDYKRKKNLKGFLTGLFNVSKEETIDLDERNYVRQCILSLPEDLKTPVVLYYYSGLSQREIADILNITSKSVEGRIYRAKQKLKLEFESGGYMLCSKNGTI